jgi:hypothetical protein
MASHTRIFLTHRPKTEPTNVGDLNLQEWPSSNLTVAKPDDLHGIMGRVEFSGQMSDVGVL